MSNNCKTCGAKIVWCKTTKGKIIPVDMYSLPESDKTLLIDRWRNGDDTPLIFNPQKHTSHFATCPHASQHREKGNTKSS
jgi:hypothetical protein